jgi:hypothetical protein
MAQGTTRGIPIDTDPLLANDSDLLVPSQKAVKAYADTKEPALGYTPATDARTLTINGTSQDLTSNRTWNVGDLLSSGSYLDPSWITSLAYSKLTGAPTIPIVGTWGALNYPTWTTGTPFVKMTAAGTFSLDLSTYITSAVTSISATGPITVSGSTGSVNVSTLMSTNKLIGRSSTGAGVMEEITLGTGLTLSAGTLNATTISADESIANALIFG